MKRFPKVDEKFLKDLKKFHRVVKEFPKVVKRLSNNVKKFPKVVKKFPKVVKKFPNNVKKFCPKSCSRANLSKMDQNETNRPKIDKVYQDSENLVEQIEKNGL